LRPVLVLLAAGVLGLVGAAGPLEVIDAMGKIKGKEEVNQFVQKRLKAADRGECSETLSDGWLGEEGGRTGRGVWSTGDDDRACLLALSPDFTATA
jgi:hypothetical protein